MKAFVALTSGLWMGVIGGGVIEFYTSYNYSSVSELLEASISGFSTNMINSLSLGFFTASMFTSTLCFSVYSAY